MILYINIFDFEKVWEYTSFGLIFIKTINDIITYNNVNIIENSRIIIILVEGETNKTDNIDTIPKNIIM